MRYEFTEKELTNAMWAHSMSAEDLARKIDSAGAQATAYVWGRQDAGESAHDTGYSLEFGKHYAEVTRAFYGGTTFSMNNIQRAYDEWRASHATAD